jgi:hypothetical protein
MIPLIFGAIALGSAALGGIAGIGGASDMSEARDIVDAAQESYKQAFSIYESTLKETQLGLKEFNKFKIELQNNIISRYAELKQQNDIFHSAHYSQFIKQLDNTISERMQQYQSGQISAEEYFQTMGSALEAFDAIDIVANGGNRKGLLAIGATKIATSVGVASTGTAISGLSGAAAHSATLAWFGGGSLAAGGGGMALGGAILTGLTVGPALAVLGFSIAGKGARELDRAIEYHNQVGEEISELAGYIDRLDLIQQRMYDLNHLIYDKYVILSEKMDDLEVTLDRYQNRSTQSIEIQKIQELSKEIFGLINQTISV